MPEAASAPQQLPTAPPRPPARVPSLSGTCPVIVSAFTMVGTLRLPHYGLRLESRARNILVTPNGSRNDE